MPEPPNPHRPVSGELMAINLTVEEWKNEGLPFGEDCRSATRNTQVVITYGDGPQSDHVRWCHSCGPTSCQQGLCASCSNACVVWPLVGVWPFALFGEREPRIIVHERAPLERAIVHEMVHILGRCSGLGVDHYHTKEEWWGSLGVEGKAKARL